MTTQRMVVIETVSEYQGLLKNRKDIRKEILFEYQEVHSEAVLVEWDFAIDI